MLLIEEIERRGYMPPDRPLPFQTSPTDETPSDNKSKLLNEILQTERAYVEGLEELNVFLRASSGLADKCGGRLIRTS